MADYSNYETLKLAGQTVLITGARDADDRRGRGPGSRRVRAGRRGEEGDGRRGGGGAWDGAGVGEEAEGEQRETGAGEGARVLGLGRSSNGELVSSG